MQGSETRGGPEPDVKVSLALGELYELTGRLRTQNLNLAKDLEDLREVHYNTEADDLSFRSQRLFTLIHEVYSGNFCIRQASRTLINSAHYYLAVLFREVIPDFSPHDVESIS